MHRNTLIVLAAFAVVLGAYVVFFEPHVPTTDERAGRAGRVLPDFVRARVTRVELNHGHERVVLAARGDFVDDGRRAFEDSFRLEVPLAGDADADAVSSLLSSLEWAPALRTLGRSSVSDRKHFGLDSPRAVLKLSVGGGVTVVRLGGTDVRGRGVYVDTGPGTDVVVTGDDLARSMLRDADFFRDKALAPDFDVDAVETVTIAAGGTTLRLVRGPDVTSITAPFRGTADRAELDVVMERLSGLRAKGFVAGAAGFGDAEAETTIEVRFADGKSIEWSFGAACAPDARARLVRVGEGPVACVEVDSVAALFREPSAFRDPRVLVAGAGDVVAIELGRPPHTLGLSRHGDVYRMRGGPGSAIVSREAVDELLGLLHATRATGFVDGGPLAQRSPERVATVTLRHGAEVALGVHRDVDGTALVQRGQERDALVVDASLLDALAPDPVRFRERALLRYDDARVGEIEIARGTSVERVVRTGDEFEVVAPIRAAADLARCRELVRYLASLHAQSFVASTDHATYGLAVPRQVVRFGIHPAVTLDDEDHATNAPAGHDGEHAAARSATAADEEHVLTVGARHGRGAFARLDRDPAVFVISEGLAEVLDAPLVARDLLAVPEEEIARVTVERGGATRHFVRTETSTFVDDRGRPLPTEEGLAVFDAVARLRATDVQPYGEEPIADSAVRVAVERVGGARHTILLGEEIGTADGPRLRASRSDVPVILWVQPESAAPFRR